SNLAKHIMKSLMTDGVVRRGYLGIEMEDLTPELANQLELKNQSGVVVKRVMAGSPAAKAGLQPEDVITGLAGPTIRDGLELRQKFIGLPLNKAVEVNVVRDGKVKVVPVTIEEQPDDFGTSRLPRFRNPREEPEGITLNKLGVAVRDMTPELARQL